MKENARLRLEEELKSGNYCSEALNVLDIFKIQGNINRLFEIYLEEEIDSVDELFVTFTHKDTDKLEFYDFVMSHIDDFKINARLLNERGFKTPEDLLGYEISRASDKVIGSLYMKRVVKSKQKFVDMANAVTRKGRVLEVGSGSDLPITSLLFAKDLGEVSSMDHFNNFWSSLSFLKKMKVNAISEYFTKDTSVDDYDTIVGQHPCEAIIPVVDKLANSDERDYFIEMCDCAFDGEMLEFLNYLRSKDRRLQSVLIKRNMVSRRLEYHLNGTNPIDYADTLYITNADKHPDDIVAKVCEIDMRDRH